MQPYVVECNTISYQKVSNRAVRVALQGAKAGALPGFLLDWAARGIAVPSGWWADVFSGCGCLRLRLCGPERQGA